MALRKLETYTNLSNLDRILFVQKIYSGRRPVKDALGLIPKDEIPSLVRDLQEVYEKNQNCSFSLDDIPQLEE